MVRAQLRGKIRRPDCVNGVTCWAHAPMNEPATGDERSDGLVELLDSIPDIHLSRGFRSARLVVIRSPVESIDPTTTRRDGLPESPVSATRFASWSSQE